MAHVWQERREEALESSASVMGAIEQNENFSSSGGELNMALADKLVASILKQFDGRNGGFGSQPKFPHCSALDLLLQAAVHRGNNEARGVFLLTLEKMARGGMYDQIAGGFHRYSVDERWVVPHFEKMLYDNTELLRNYVHGFQSYVRNDFLETAREIIGWLDDTMTDRERGGFYASQDADIDLDDDGDYFTWTLDEARAVLDAEELDAASLYWDIGDLGDMHHNPAKNVLHVKYTIEELAERNNLPQGQSAASMRALLDSARQKLLAARRQRPTPFIDRTLYTGWNAMAVTAYLEAAVVMRLEPQREFALRTLSRLLAEAWDGVANLYHVIDYHDTALPSERIAGTLDDYAFTVHACIDGWLASGELRFYDAAVALADAMIAKFYDRTADAFCDTEIAADGAVPLGALTARRRPLQDSPTPAGNPTAASALIRLETLSGRKEYREIAEDTLASFSGIVEHFGLYAGSYGLALVRLLADPIQVVVVGDGTAGEKLAATATAGFGTHKTVIQLTPEQLSEGKLPPALEETVLRVPIPNGIDAWALVCRGRTCLPPIMEPDALIAALQS
jgi:uncharacterized protein YyaL (SSP411 family)